MRTDKTENWNWNKLSMVGRNILINTSLVSISSLAEAVEKYSIKSSVEFFILPWSFAILYANDMSFDSLENVKEFSDVPLNAMALLKYFCDSIDKTCKCVDAPPINKT